MSAERLVNAALLRLFLLRLLGDLVSIPRSLCQAVGALVAAVTGVFAAIERTVFMLEVDAARRYRALTDVDLGLALGETTRYSGVRPGVADRRDRAMDGIGFGTASEDE